ncbi:glycoside hydrolase family 15 [Peribacillus cavernae]|uniref:Glycoside hydrolase family 15 n=1 Tax=Peribacillus cavernae TaxID=1674310 RepID=A0A433HS41_9BACI|nr:glycoside hydrolase family 15 protein [Peribacillus cavernae]MDQ0218875.1 phosphorylase kinase alpha/beta subunit [Peribacillus cavernae]RUQ31074.1 glycoside hydrolase family 15 [Peribacillus cavernae]
MNGEKAISVLDQMRLPNGAYTASVSQDYGYVWIRDVIYTVLPFLHTACGRYEKAYHSLFDLFRKYEWKIDIHTKKKPVYLHEFIHSRYARDLTELHVEWGHAQNDAIGAFLWGVGEGVRKGKKVIRDERDLQIVQKLVHYLDCLQYWQAKDNGMWEENMEVHASSVGACVAGLHAVKMLVDVKEDSIHKGEETLRFMLPRESETKETDLALLSLIFPYRIVDRRMALAIANHVSSKLERQYGCIRYEDDQYYNEGSEAEWCFGIPWLGLCYRELGMMDKVQEYIKKTMMIVPENWEVPELYIGGKNMPNKNTPLAWAVSLSYLFLEGSGEGRQYKIQ